MRLNVKPYFCRGKPLCNNTGAPGGNPRNGATEHVQRSVRSVVHRTDCTGARLKLSRRGPEREQRDVNRTRISVAFYSRLFTLFH